MTVEGELGCNGCAMRKALATIAAILIVLGASSPSWAGYDEGVAAAKRGDYATALREFWALAQRGDAEGQNGLGVMYIKGWGALSEQIGLSLVARFLNLRGWKIRSGVSTVQPM